jgi:pimeloyl-ACP methyl ester carboxylesterase
MASVRTGLGPVHFVERGQGLPVVLLHANLHDHRDYGGVLDGLAEHFRVLAPDWPGHGASGPIPPGRTVGAGELADVLVDFTERLDPGPAVLVGNSVGGFAAARLAITHPERVAGLVLVNSGGFTRRGPHVALGTRLLGRPGIYRRVSPFLVPRYMAPRTEEDRRITAETVARGSSGAGARTAAGLWRSFGHASFDLRPQAARITAPTLVVFGRRDIVFTRGAGRQTRAAIPGARLRTFDTGHVVFASDPAGFLAEVLPFAEAAHRAARGAAA